jgi:hypothetical protein
VTPVLGPARPLPILAAPAAGETVETYLHRLAQLNRVHAHDLKLHLGLNPTRWVETMTASTVSSLATLMALFSRHRRSNRRQHDVHRCGRRCRRVRPRMGMP